MHKLLSKDQAIQVGTVKLADGSYTNTNLQTLSRLADVHFPSHDDNVQQPVTSTPNNSCPDFTLANGLFNSEAIN